jgi:hypothetical protein
MHPKLFPAFSAALHHVAFRLRRFRQIAFAAAPTLAIHQLATQRAFAVRTRHDFPELYSFGFRVNSNARRPNHALQRTAPHVTAPASTAAFPPTMQVPRRAPRSLSLGR